MCGDILPELPFGVDQFTASLFQISTDMAGNFHIRTNVNQLQGISLCFCSARIVARTPLLHACGEAAVQRGCCLRIRQPKLLRLLAQDIFCFPR